MEALQMIDMTDKLVDLICESMQEDDCIAHCNHPPCHKCKMIAERLIANGVIALPCKAGDIVWFNTYKNNATECIGIQPHKIDRIDISFVCDTAKVIPTRIPDWSIGKTVFLTKEEAEKGVINSE